MRCDGVVSLWVSWPSSLCYSQLVGCLAPSKLVALLPSKQRRSRSQTRWNQSDRTRAPWSCGRGGGREDLCAARDEWRGFEGKGGGVLTAIVLALRRRLRGSSRRTSRGPWGWTRDFGTNFAADVEPEPAPLQAGLTPGAARRARGPTGACL